MGTIQDSATLANTLANTHWDTYKAAYGSVAKPVFNLVSDSASASTRYRGNKDEVLFYVTATASRSGHDGYRDIQHDYKGRLHRVQVDIRTYTSRANLMNMLNILNKVYEVNQTAPGTGWDKITFPYGDGTDFSSEKDKRWRWVYEFALVKEYDAVH